MEGTKQTKGTITINGDVWESAIGRSVQLHPANDAWMQGDRFGVVVNIGGRYIHIKMDKSGRTLSLVRELFEFVEA